MKKQNRAELLARHLNNLSIIIGVPMDEIKVVYKQLKDLEHKGHHAATQYCNGEIENIDDTLDLIKTRLKTLIKNNEVLKNIHLNTDPRGYFLKINDEFMRAKNLNLEKDWGGYGIVCPNQEVS